MKPLILTASLTLTLPALAIQSFPHDAATKTANQWEVVDIDFKAATLPDHPDRADLTADLKSADGESRKVHAFYNGGNTYTLRFTAPPAGEWSYQLTSSIPELDGASGKLSVAAPLDGRKGGIRVNPRSPLEFQYDNGDPYYPICFEVDWLFALDAGNPDDIPVTRTFVDTIAGNGYNQVIMNVFAYDVDWKKDPKLKPEHDYGSPKAFPFHGSNEKPDHTRLNIEYFQRLDRVIEYLDRKGIASHLMIYVWNKRVNWPAPDSPEDNAYFDYVVKRYQGFPNIVWDISKEALAYGRDDVGYITRRIGHIRQLDTHKRLVTVHDYSYCAKNPDKLDFISVQLWQSELHHVMREVVKKMPGKPILNIEHGGYERSPYVVFTGAYTTPEVNLERAYQCVFAGTYPSHYWQGSAWNAIIPDISSLPPEQRPKLEYYRYLSELVAKYDIGSLKAGDQRSNSGFSLHNGKDLTLYYVPKENEHIGVKAQAKNGFLVGTWFNPFTGEYSEPVRQKITQWPSFEVPPGDGFRILIVQAEPAESE